MKINVSDLVEYHYHALTEILLALNGSVLKVIVGERFPSFSAQSRNINVRAMENEGKGKVRYCGAWATAKVKNSCRSYLKSNIHSSDRKIRIKAKQEYVKSELLSQLTWSSSAAQ